MPHFLKILYFCQLEKSPCGKSSNFDIFAKTEKSFVVKVGILSPDSLGQRLCNNLIICPMHPAKRPECEDSKENVKLHTWRNKSRIAKCFGLKTSLKTN